MRGGGAAVVIVLALAGCVANPAAHVEDQVRDGLSAEIDGAFDTTGAFSRVLQAGSYPILPDEVFALESDLDGATIQLAVSRPDVPPGTKVPIILWISPYLRDLATTPISEQDDSGGQHIDNVVVVDNGVPGAFYVENFVPHGYAVAVIAVRGTAGSGGCLDLNGPKERADVLQAIDWLAQQPWTDGRMGGYGLSYDGWTLWALASTGHPALKTVVVTGTLPDAWDLVVRNGTTNSRGVLIQPFISTFEQRYRDPAQVPGTACPDILHLEADAAQGLARPDRAARSNGFFSEREFSKKIEENYRGSALVMHGFRDSVVPVGAAYPWALRLDEAGIPTKHMLGWWDHSAPDNHGETFHNPTVRWDAAEITLRWFDRWLKGNTAVDTGPRLQVADSAGRWRVEQGWPPGDSTPLEHYLTAAGSLTTDGSSTTGSLPITAASPLIFTSAPLEHELRFAGEPQAHLSVTPMGAGGRLFVTIFAEQDAGRIMLATGAMDLAYASSEDPVLVMPGAAMLAPLELEPVDAVVPPGARLALEISTAGAGEGSDARTGDAATPVLFVNVGGTTSVLRVQQFHRVVDDGRFFEPPGGAG